MYLNLYIVGIMGNVNTKYWITDELFDYTILGDCATLNHLGTGGGGGQRMLTPFPKISIANNKLSPKKIRHNTHIYTMKYLNVVLLAGVYNKVIRLIR